MSVTEVSSCDDLDIISEGHYTRIQAKATCTASTEHSSAHSCEKALDDDLQTSWATKSGGVGSWIQVK